MNWLRRLFHRHRPVPGTEYWDAVSEVRLVACRCGAELYEIRPWEEYGH